MSNDSNRSEAKSKLETFVGAIQNYKQVKTESSIFSSEGRKQRKDAKEAYHSARHAYLTSLPKDFFMGPTNRKNYLKLIEGLYGERTANENFNKLFDRYNFLTATDVLGRSILFGGPQLPEDEPIDGELAQAVRDMNRPRVTERSQGSVDGLTSVSGGLERRAPITRTDSNVSVSRGKAKGITR